MSTSAALRAVLDDAVHRYRLPGVQATVRWADGVEWRGRSGTADAAGRVALPPDAVFRVGSVTKLFTAVLILQLVDRGELRLDDPVARWFPDLPEADRITIRQLLSHRSGIPEVLRSKRVLARTMVGDHRWRPDDLVRIAARRARTAAPDERFDYSNTNYILLGRIAERVTGRSAARLLRERIAEPLGLANTRLVPDDAPTGGLLTGYDRDMIPWPGFYRLRPEARSWATVAYTAGAVVSTSDDLMRFVEALATGRLLSPRAREEMFAFRDAPMPTTPAQRGYGLGVELLEMSGVEGWGHLGAFVGFSAAAVHIPTRGVTIAVIGNLSTFDVMQVVTDLERSSAVRVSRQPINE